MAETMLERAVRAATIVWDEYDYPDPEVVEKVARAVIASLREPSEAVAAVGARAARWVHNDEMLCAFNAMIDAILEEPKA